MSTRQLTEDGFKTKKSQTVNKVTTRFIPLDYDGERGSEETKALRRELLNNFKTYLVEAGYEEEAGKLSDLSYEERGLAIKPQKHMGKAATALERQGIQTEKGNYNREVKAFNEQLKVSIELARASLDAAKASIAEAREYLKASRLKVTTYIDDSKQFIVDLYQNYVNTYELEPENKEIERDYIP